MNKYLIIRIIINSLLIVTPIYSYFAFKLLNNTDLFLMLGLALPFGVWAYIACISVPNDSVDWYPRRCRECGTYCDSRFEVIGGGFEPDVIGFLCEDCSNGNRTTKAKLRII